MDEPAEMKTGQFWRLIALANKDYDAFKQALQGLSREELTGFAWRFQGLMGPLYEGIENEDDFSEDRLQDLIAWIVARGKKFYENVLDNPEQMPVEVNKELPGGDMLFQALKAYYDRFGEHVPIYGGY